MPSSFEIDLELDLDTESLSIFAEEEVGSKSRSSATERGFAPLGRGKAPSLHKAG